MSKVSAGKKQHRSLRGKPVDMALLQKRNELTPAVGNARVNARGALSTSRPICTLRTS